MPTDSLKAFHERLGRLIEECPEAGELPIVTIGKGGALKVSKQQTFVKVVDSDGEVVGLQLSLGGDHV